MKCLGLEEAEGLCVAHQRQGTNQARVRLPGRVNSRSRRSRPERRRWSRVLRTSHICRRTLPAKCCKAEVRGLPPRGTLGNVKGAEESFRCGTLSVECCKDDVEWGQEKSRDSLEDRSIGSRERVIRKYREVL